jgi:predicted nucleic acid-binding protein
VTVGSAGPRHVRAGRVAGREVGASAIAWSEFCKGPLTREQKEAAFAVLNRNLRDFTWQDGEEAVRLFNLGGRRRGSHADGMIAARAIATGAGLATRKPADFARFVPLELRLEALP